MVCECVLIFAATDFDSSANWVVIRHAEVFILEFFVFSFGDIQKSEMTAEFNIFLL